VGTGRVANAALAAGVEIADPVQFAEHRQRLALARTADEGLQGLVDHGLLGAQARQTPGFLQQDALDLVDDAGGDAAEEGGLEG
jgi:hypothetical protein